MDNYFRSFDQLRVNELTVIRHGFFRPWYELTDGQFMYGKLSYMGWLRRMAVLQTAHTNWQIAPKGLFSRVLYINSSAAENIGSVKPEVWTRKIKLSMNNGFEGIFTTKKVFCRTFTFTNDQNGDMFSVTPNIWKFKTPFSISFTQDMSKIIPELPMYMLTGVYLVLLRQQQAAAAH